MTDVLLILHFIGLMLGAGGGLGSTVVMSLTTGQSRQKGPMKALGPVLAHVSMSGLIVMWGTGIPLLFLNHSLDVLPVMFWFKIGFVLLLTFAVVSIEMTYSRVKAGDATAANLLPSLGPMAGLSSLMAVIFAVLTFH